MSLLPVAAPRRPASWGYWLCLAAITILAAILRGVRLDHPMRYDEAFTFLRFAFRDSPGAWFEYSTPNNHVLHTLAVRLMIYLVGPWPAVVRMPAFLAGVALVPSAAALAYRIAGRALPALVAAALVGASSLLVEYSVNARGYSMLCLAALWLAIFTVAICQEPSRLRWWAGWVLVAAAGMFAVPVMLYPILIFTVILLLQVLLGRARPGVRGAVLVRLACALPVAGAVTLLLYLPVMYVSGIGAIAANRFLLPRPLSEVLDGLPRAAAEALAHWARDASLPWLALLGAGLLTAVVVGLRRRRVFSALPLIAPALLGVGALAQRVVPFPRVWIFLLPILLVLAACGLWELAERISPRRAPWVGALALVLATGAGVGDQARRLRGREFLISEDERTLVDAKAIARDAAELCDGHTALVSQAPAWPPLAYYHCFYGRRAFVSYTAGECTRVVVVVGSGQSLRGVLAANPAVVRDFGPLALWREYPRAKVYLAWRRPFVPADGRTNSP